MTFRNTWSRWAQNTSKQWANNQCSCCHDIVVLFRRLIKIYLMRALFFILAISSPSFVLRVIVAQLATFAIVSFFVVNADVEVRWILLVVATLIITVAALTIRVRLVGHRVVLTAAVATVAAISTIIVAISAIVTISRHHITWCHFGWRRSWHRHLRIWWICCFTRYTSTSTATFTSVLAQCSWCGNWHRVVFCIRNTITICEFVINQSFGWTFNFPNKWFLILIIEPNCPERSIFIKCSQVFVLISISKTRNLAIFYIIRIEIRTTGGINRRLKKNSSNWFNKLFSIF